MNQIIYPENLEKNLIDYKKHILKKRKSYRHLFILSMLLLLAFIIYYSFLYFRLVKNERIAKDFLALYDIQKLYASSIPIQFPDVVAEDRRNCKYFGNYPNKQNKFKVSYSFKNNR